MSTVVFKEQRQNRDPLAPGDFQEWHDFDGPHSDKGAFLISAFASMPPGLAGQGGVLAVEYIRTETRKRHDEPTQHKIHFHVRNVGSSPVNKYVVNVWHVLP